MSKTRDNSKQVKGGVMKLQDKQNILYPQRRYYGKLTAQALVFNANLQEFATRVTYRTHLTSKKRPQAFSASV